MIIALMILEMLRRWSIVAENTWFEHQHNTGHAEL
jgi:hypothetical protein